MIIFDPVNLIERYSNHLNNINDLLKEKGYPEYWYGGKSFNEQYRMSPLPRITLMWRPPFRKLAQVYLIFYSADAKIISIKYLSDNKQLIIEDLTNE